MARFTNAPDVGAVTINGVTVEFGRHHVWAGSVWTGAYADYLNSNGIYRVDDFYHNGIALPSSAAGGTALGSALHLPGDTHPAYRNLQTQILAGLNQDFMDATNAHLVADPTLSLSGAQRLAHQDIFPEFRGYTNWFATNLAPPVNEFGHVLTWDGVRLTPDTLLSSGGFAPLHESDLLWQGYRI